MRRASSSPPATPTGCGTTIDPTTDTNSNGTIDFGEWYKPSKLTSMTALVPQAAQNDTISVNITPYTELAARRAKAAATLDAAAIASANSEVSNLLGGIDILNTKPLDITDPSVVNDSPDATQMTYAAMTAAVAVLADSSGGESDIDSALNMLSTSFTDGKILADDAGSANDASTYSLQEIIDATNSAYTEIGKTDLTGTLLTLQTEVGTAISGDGYVDPAPSPSAGDTTLAKVKAFVTDLRTWGTVIGAEMQTKGDAFSNEADMAGTAVDMTASLIIDPAMQAIVNLMNVYDGSSTSLVYYNVGFSAGSITESSTGLTISNGVIGGTTVNMAVTLPADGTTASTMSLGIASASISNATMDASINKGIITLNLATPYTIDYNAIASGTAPDPDITTAGFDMDASLTQKKDAQGANLAAAVTFAGKLQTTVYPLFDATTGDLTWATPSTLTLNGSVSSASGHSLTGSFTANIANASSFTPVGELPAGTTKTDILTWSYSGDTFTAITPDLTMLFTWNSNDGSVTTTFTTNDGQIFTNTYYGNYTDIVNAVQNTYIYTSLYWYLNGGTMWVRNEGEYVVDPTAAASADLSQNGSLDGILMYPDFVVEGSGAGEWLDASIGVTTSLKLAGLPEASLNITADRTGYESATASATIAYGTRKIEISGSGDATSVTGSLTITNQDGVKLTITPDTTNTYGEIKYNNNLYGKVEDMSNGLLKITYSDGTFETL